MQADISQFESLQAHANQRMMSPMSCFNSQLSDGFVEKVKPFHYEAAQAGDDFRAQKEAFMGQFESRGVTGPEFKKVYSALRELNGGKRTLKSVVKQFPSIPKKEIQTLAKVAQGEQGMLDSLGTFLHSHTKLSQEADKQYRIFDQLQNGDKDLDAAYETFKNDIEDMDNNVRAGLK